MAGSRAKPKNEAIRIGKAAEMLGVSPDTLRRWSATGKLRTRPSRGGQRRIALSDVVRLPRAKRAKASQPPPAARAAAAGERRGAEVELGDHARRSEIAPYAKARVHQNALGHETQVQARAAMKNAVGATSATPLDPADPRRLTADARAAAELSVPN